MSATPDLDALTARVEHAITSTILRQGTADLLRDLLTYATTVRQERDDYWSALSMLSMAVGSGDREPDTSAESFVRGINEGWDRIIGVETSRRDAAEQQVASLTAQLAEARAQVTEATR